MTHLIRIDADPTRNYSLGLTWPGIGHWNFTQYRWVPVFDPSHCLLHFTSDPDNPAKVFVWLHDPGASSDILVKLFASTPEGLWVEIADDVLEGRETYYPPITTIQTVPSLPPRLLKPVKQ